MIMPSALAVLIAALAWLATAAAPTAAQDQSRPGASPSFASPGTSGLPAAAVTSHSIEFAGRTLRFAATAGSFRISDPQGAPQADLAFIAYTLDGAEPRTRPVTFAFNGGPGFASAWLHLGAMGPWRLPMAGAALAPSAPPVLLPNAETWLDFTDLVFIDPAGTGYSRFATGAEELRRRLWSVDGDIQSLAQFIRRWLERHGRLASPKFIVGESYGGFRAPRVARTLQSGLGIGIDGLVLVSPQLDFGGRSGVFDPLSWVGRLPSMAAIAQAPEGDVSPAFLAEVEEYAVRSYLPDLLQGGRDQAAMARAVRKVAALTGLPPDLVAEHGARIDVGTFLRETHRGDRRVGSRYDGTVTIPAPSPPASGGLHPDPILDGLAAPLTETMLQLYDRLGWRPDGLYALQSEEASRSWNWGGNGTRPEAVSALMNSLALDHRLRVMVAHGVHDLQTPYFATRLILDSRAPIGPPERIRQYAWPGGHMFYTRDGSRAAFRDAGRVLIMP